VILYVLLCGFPPFFADHDGDLYALIRTGSFGFPAPYWDDVSDKGASPRWRCRWVASFLDPSLTFDFFLSLTFPTLIVSSLFTAKDLIRRMLVVDVTTRLTPQQVLQHPFIADYRSLSFTRRAGLPRELSLHLVTQKILKKVRCVCLL